MVAAIERDRGAKLSNERNADGRNVSDTGRLPAQPFEEGALTVETEPAAATELFGDRSDLARQFTASLVEEGELRGLIGPSEIPRIWTRHILNSAVMAPLLKNNARVADVGSGAGLPGIVLAIARPDVQFTLIEPMERRTQWLQEQVDALGLSNVTVERARAEESRFQGSFDQVTARAVSALRTLVPITAPLAKSGGELVFLKGANVKNEIGAAAKALAKAGIRDSRVEILGEGLLGEPTRVYRGTIEKKR